VQTPEELMNSGLLRAAVLAAGTIIAPAASEALTISGTYFEDSISINCNSEFACNRYFTPLPSVLTGKFLMLREINCTMNVNQGLQRMSLFIADSTSGLNTRRYQHLAVDVATKNTFGIYQPMHFKISGGPPRVLGFYIVAGNTATQFTGSCNVIGEIVDQ